MNYISIYLNFCLDKGDHLRTAIKILSFDGQGFWLCSKRLSKGKFTAKLFPSDNSSYQICYRTLHILIHNGDPSSAKFSNDWLPVV
ncbi:IS66 family insertion sequence element accessory protein TnpB [Rickettsia endosymbiont of Oedothorax gibbosus]|uniref:IS66 family insertion sequence element accessory protein TnpB n=1 Tax=Rickettsia endosymbiont of Oedothorax gibbosus TaxID=931099 RepID=UPI00397DD4A6